MDLLAAEVDAMLDDDMAIEDAKLLHFGPLVPAGQGSDGCPVCPDRGLGADRASASRAPFDCKAARLCSSSRFYCKAQTGILLQSRLLRVCSVPQNTAT
jgi:hypothetical protein